MLETSILSHFSQFSILSKTEITSEAAFILLSAFALNLIQILMPLHYFIGCYSNYSECFWGGGGGELWQKRSVLVHKLFATRIFYAPLSKDWGHIVLPLSVCLSAQT